MDENVAYFSDTFGWVLGEHRDSEEKVKRTLQKVTYLKSNIWILITRITCVKDTEANSSVEEATVQYIVNTFKQKNKQ